MPPVRKTRGLQTSALCVSTVFRDSVAVLRDILWMALANSSHSRGNWGNPTRELCYAKRWKVCDRVQSLIEGPAGICIKPALLSRLPDHMKGFASQISTLTPVELRRRQCQNFFGLEISMCWDTMVPNWC